LPCARKVGEIPRNFGIGLLLAEIYLAHPRAYEGGIVETRLQNTSERKSGRVMVPALLYMAGVPFGIVLLLWFFFFRG
jgi:hypothetical protein